MKIENNKFRLSKNIISIKVVCLVAFFACLVIFISIKPKLDILSDEVIKINVKTKFVIPSATAKYLNLDVTKDIKITNNVNSEIPGEYEINYEIKKMFYDVKKIYKVIVEDQTAPKINLNGGQNIKISNINDYIEEGYSASDNLDGDITNKVLLIKDTNKIIYSVSDAAGNTSQIERIFIIDNTNGPVITLNGTENLYIALGTEYTEYGASATDDHDSVINIEITDNIDINKAGLYYVTYTAVDSDNNKTSYVRNVYVYDPNTVQSLNGGESGVIYLTFDDGPGQYTSEILDILAKYNIKATFFVTSNGEDSLIKREYEDGHTVGIHTSSHKWNIYKSEETYFADLKIVSDRVKSITGQTPYLMRFPGGSSNTISRRYSKGIMTYLTSEVLNRGYHYFDWNVSVEDAGTCTKKSTLEDKKKCSYDYFVNGLSFKRANVVLMHDIKKSTSEELKNMINYGIANGYTFAKITLNTKEIHQKVNN